MGARTRRLKEWWNKFERSRKRKETQRVFKKEIELKEQQRNENKLRNKLREEGNEFEGAMTKWLEDQGKKFERATKTKRNTKGGAGWALLPTIWGHTRGGLKRISIGNEFKRAMQNK